MLLTSLVPQAEKLVLELERKSDQKLAEYKEGSRQLLVHAQEEHAALVRTTSFQHFIFLHLRDASHGFSISSDCSNNANTRCTVPYFLDMLTVVHSDACHLLFCSIMETCISS